MEFLVPSPLAKLNQYSSCCCIRLLSEICRFERKCIRNPRASRGRERESESLLDESRAFLFVRWGRTTNNFSSTYLKRRGGGLQLAGQENGNDCETCLSPSPGLIFYLSPSHLSELEKEVPRGSSFPNFKMGLSVYKRINQTDSPEGGTRYRPTSHENQTRRMKKGQSQTFYLQASNSLLLGT